jgi:uncharacterized protein YqgC (DUF456 family)
MPLEQALSEGTIFGLAVGVMALGLAGIVLPLLPGLPLIWLAALVYGFHDGFRLLDGWTFALLTLLALIGTAAEVAAGHMGARAGGASHAGGLAAIVGGVIGLLVFSLPGALIGALLAVFLVELRRMRDWRHALRSSGGWLAGWTAGVGARLAIGALMIAIFVARVLLAS